MSTTCPLCSQAVRDLFALSLHVEERHAADQHRIVAVLIAPALPIIELDIDQIHSSRIAAIKTAEATA
jgi:hypothetical protein